MFVDPLSLKLFVSIVEEGTIAGAAAREHIAASAVSKRISELEERFGTPLLLRTNKGVLPTEAGLTLLQSARGLLHDMNSLSLQMNEYSSGIRGHVRLSANISAINQFLPAEMKTFMELHPLIQVQLEVELSERSMGLVAAGTTDVAIITGEVYRTDLEYRPYHSDQLIVITPKEHPLAGRRSIRFQELIDFDIVGLPVGSALHNRIVRAAYDLDATPKIRIQVSSFDALCLMVESGLGIGIVPKGAAQPYFKGLRIRSMSLNEPWAQRELKLCIRSADALSPAAKLLVDHLSRQSA